MDIYTYKDSYKKGLCFRCINRKTCKLTIIIEEDVLKKISENKNKTIKYIINSK